MFTAHNCIFWDGADSFVNTANLATDAVMYSTSGNALPAGTGNNTNDPQLDSGGRPCNSSTVVINTGDQTLLPADLFDIDDDSGTSVLPLDLDEARRVRDGEVDRGAFEVAEPDYCPADVNDDGQVDVTDLLAVIGAWGACGSPCPADVAPYCALDGQVDNTDLLAVIGSWGACPTGEENLTSGGGIGQAEVQGCIDAALQNNLEGEAFAAFVYECLQNILNGG